MLRLFADFNDRTQDGKCWNLMYEGASVDDKILRPGEIVILFQDNDDFEVQAEVNFVFVSELERDIWVAIPDWSTKKNISSP
jgi:hypothetical protein